MKVKLLTKAEITKTLKSLNGWTLNAKGTALSHVYAFSNHIDALVFIARITVHAQVLDHHPEIIFSFKKVKVTTTTHDAKGLTAKDVELARRIHTILKVDK